MIRLNTEETDKIRALKAGDTFLLTGTIYTARDAAHKRMYESGQYPIDLRGQIIYYAGPCPAAPDEVIGPCGPTTSGRMDAYAPKLLDDGLFAMIGKGARNKAVTEAIVRNKAVYLGTIGGAGALIADSIKSAEVVAYDDLGTEAIRRLYVEDFPCTVLTDSEGNDAYEIGQSAFKSL